MKSWNYQVAGTIDVSTTGNIDDLDFQYCSVIRMTNASLATIRGLKAGFPGQEVTIISTGAGQVNLSHQNAGSSAANRLINTVTSGITPLAAGKGQATYKYDDTTARWRLISHIQGTWIDVPFSAGNFTATTGTWTVESGDQLTYSYVIINGTITISLVLTTTTVSAITAELLVTIPESFITIIRQDMMGYCSSGGGATEPMQTYVTNGGTQIHLVRFNTNWAIGAGNDTTIVVTIVVGIS